MKLIIVFITILFISKGNSQAISMHYLVERQGIYYKVNSEMPFSGVAFSEYSNTQKEEENTFRNGVRHGKSLKWFNNGQIKFTGTYDSGYLEGKVMTYYENGQLEFEGNYKTGVKQGTCKEWYENGQIKFEGNYNVNFLTGFCKKWYENGSLESEGTYLMNKYDGNVTEYYRNGVIKKRGTYLKGTRINEFSEYYENGQLKMNCNFSPDGKQRVGLFLYFYENGQPRIICDFVEDKLNGSFKAFFADGKPSSIGNYTLGKKSGVWHEYSINKTYSPDGFTREIANYVADSLDGYYVCWAEVDSGNECGKFNTGTARHIKAEGCFNNGKMDGVFKFWQTQYMSHVPSNTYYRQIWRQGIMTDSGWDKGHVIEFDDNDKIIDRYKYLLDDPKTAERFNASCKLNCN